MFSIDAADGVTRAGIHRLQIVILAGNLLLLGSVVSADSDQGQRIYRQNCAPCHGELGRGDGAGAQSLPVRPADHTNSVVMKSRSDAFLRDVITKGGGAMGLSMFMPAWKGLLKEEQVQDLVDYIRTLAKPSK